MMGRYYIATIGYMHLKIYIFSLTISDKIGKRILAIAVLDALAKKKKLC